MNLLSSNILFVFIHKFPFFHRLILHSDVSNPNLDSLEAVETEIFAFDPAVFVVGGLQMMDNFPFKES